MVSETPTGPQKPDDGHIYLEFLDVNISRSISVKQLKGLPDFLLLLLGQLWFGGCLLPRRGHGALQ